MLFRSPALYLLAAASLACSSTQADSAPSNDAGSLVDGPVPPGAALRNVDVTVVYPLPPRDQVAALLGPADLGRGGQPLLVAAAFENGVVPDLDAISPSSESERLTSLRAIAIRFDPCPGVVVPVPAGTACQPVVRLVFQSLRTDAAETEVRDGAIHAFYRLPNDDWSAVLQELRAIRGEDQAAAPTRLDAHPRLRTEGPAGAYATRLKALVTRFASSENLVRVTHFRRIDPAFFRWEFAIRERASEGVAWSSANIATTGHPTQTLTTIVGGRWDAIIDPPVTHADSVTRVFTESDPAAMKRGLVPIARVLNPRVHTSETVDCASCHIAPDVAAFLKTTQQLSVTDVAEHFASSYTTDVLQKPDESVVAFDNIHMLSYAGRSLSITPRVANETAAVLEMVNGVR